MNEAWLEFLKNNSFAKAPVTQREREEAAEAVFRAGYDQGYMAGSKMQQSLMRIRLGLATKEDDR